ncbi:AEC family transporter [Vibrio europaeus]|uniref:AEC family transporter n=1 Tax=Vibrio europaeus TaxID=300876 RepID=A0AAE7AZV3_9VIBR|nr:AEC family transporter [Vibrio europaeus]MDC5805780.1 AEC family transporter [Vibrio europaeus]MDC5812077.1 AEC family transporter [Vibrio europaeus]MDC5826146.1 AEC family transporter [Vibrio europaeus]MDC5831511.1 AEC family transporter [Vibrio europaeus]MDC5834466.1 AEC family transporter [Vibrio europaeus]
MEQVKLMSWIILGLVSAKGISALSKPRVDWVRNFAFSYLTPCLFFSSVYRADLANLPSAQVLATYALCFGGLFIVLRFWLTKYVRDTLSASNIKAISALYPNAVGVGVPVVFALYGTEAELILMGIVVTNLLVVLPLINVLMIRSGERGFYSYRKVATDPILLSIVGGITLNVWGIELNSGFVSGLAHIGWIALPVILFILGASLSFYSFNSLAQEKIGALLIVKIVIFPVLTLLAAHYVFHLSLLETQVLVLLASLPTGVNVYLLSERYQVAKEATAGVILFTTISSLVSLFGWEKVLQHWAV